MGPSGIHFHTEEVDFQLKRSKKTIPWISETLLNENKSLGVLNFIFCSDLYLLSINKQYLKHDTFTDIITFNYVENDIISGDVFISVDRVNENSEELNIPFITELKRVLIHGVLHLCGYNDKTAEEAQKIREKEDFYLTLSPEI